MGASESPVVGGASHRDISPKPPTTSLAPSRTDALNSIAERAAKAQARIRRFRQ